MEGNGGIFIKKASIKEALESDKYDIITLQQVSGLSGKFETYIPFITEISDFVREKQPDVHICFHKTWSYEIDSNHGDFIKYNCDQNEMYRGICDATEKASKLIAADIISVGDVIQRIREEQPSFIIKTEGFRFVGTDFIYL